MKHIEAAPDTGTDRAEMYTGPYAERFGENKEIAVEPYSTAAKKLTELGLGINAGHDLDLNNLAWFKGSVPNLLEVSIGHALISDALYYGLENTIMMYRKRLA